MRVSASEMRSEKEWPASESIAAEFPNTPATSLKIESPRFTPAPTHVIRDASRLSQPSLRSLALVDTWRCMTLHAITPCISVGRTNSVCTERSARVSTGSDGRRGVAETAVEWMGRARARSDVGRDGRTAEGRTADALTNRPSHAPIKSSSVAARCMTSTVRRGEPSQGISLRHRDLWVSRQS